MFFLKIRLEWLSERKTTSVIVVVCTGTRDVSKPKHVTVLAMTAWLTLYLTGFSSQKSYV